MVKRLLGFISFYSGHGRRVLGSHSVGFLARLLKQLHYLADPWPPRCSRFSSPHPSGGIRAQFFFFHRRLKGRSLRVLVPKDDATIAIKA